MLRQRRALKGRAHEDGFLWSGEEEFMAVIQDALVEMGLEDDAEECGRLMRGVNGSHEQRYRCVLVQQRFMPLQTEFDA